MEVAAHNDDDEAFCPEDRYNELDVRYKHQGVDNRGRTGITTHNKKPSDA